MLHDSDFRGIVESSYKHTYTMRYHIIYHLSKTVLSESVFSSVLLARASHNFCLPLIDTKLEAVNTCSSFNKDIFCFPISGTYHGGKPDADRPGKRSQGYDSTCKRESRQNRYFGRLNWFIFSYLVCIIYS